MPADVVVFGQLARDLVLVVDDVPGAGESAPVRERGELLGGKGANQAVALAQLGTPSALVAAAGDDAVGTGLLRQAEDDGIDMSATVRRKDTRTGLIVDIVDQHSQRRYLEQLPSSVQLGTDDIQTAKPLLADAHWASIQLQQPPQAALAAARAARRARCEVVLDGAPEDGRNHDELLRSACVVRADKRETGLLTGIEVEDREQARRAAAEIMRHGPELVALAVGDEGNYFAWPGGDVLLPLSPVPVVDTTGAGDALTAALIAGLRSGYAPRRAAQLAVAAAGATVGHAGGRPRLTGPALARQVRAQARATREEGEPA